MRPEHAPAGDPCTKCGLAAARHRKRDRKRADYWRERSRNREEQPRRIIGIDGEGYTTPEGHHLYVYMAASDENGIVSDVSNDRGLQFSEVAEWVLSLPSTALLVGFSLAYDRTKWIESLSPAAIYSIEHPDERCGEHGPLPVTVGRYRVNLVSTRFSVRRCIDGERSEIRTVWDLFKFFQSSFVAALRKWKIASTGQAWSYYCQTCKGIVECVSKKCPKCGREGESSTREIETIRAMKDRRGSFEGITQAERLYCQQECRMLAMLARELLSAHESEGLTLKSYYGPGSTASLILARCNAKEQAAKIPEPMKYAVDCSFFGGRFEDSHVGPIRLPSDRKLWAWDIAGAYPYGFCLLPCMAHGRFVHVREPEVVIDALMGEPPACISFMVQPHPDACPAWGPLPHRLPDGNIVFPVASAGGWAWNHEVRAALKIHPGVTPLEAWVWRPDCSCPPPFLAEFARGFIDRLRHGKTTRGHTLRLGYNSGYGKSAQQVGAGVYRCMVRAGLITSRARAMLLEAISFARDPWNVLELATDSVLSLEPLELPAPIDLGTAEAAREKGKVPLGGWEPKPWEGVGIDGTFLLRPGLRFALGENDDVDKTAARGVGVRTLHRNRQAIVRAWEQSPMMPTTVQQPSMFHGSRSSVRRVERPTPWGDTEYEYIKADHYGRWEDPKPRILNYAPAPKRSGILPSPVHQAALALLPWQLPLDVDSRSRPYRWEEDDLERILREEQPEAGYTSYV